MTNPFDTLRGMLKNEGTRGYDNQTVRGGLDKYLPAFEQQARNASFDESLIAEAAAWIKDYGALAPEQRAEAIRAIIPKLATALPRPQPQSQSAPPRPPERPAEPPRHVANSQPSQNQKAVNGKTVFTQDVGSAPAMKAAPSQNQVSPPAPAGGQPGAPAPQPPRGDRPQPRPAPRPSPPKPAPPPPAKRKDLPPEPAGVGLDAPLTVLRGIGPKQAGNLQRLGLRTMRDALNFFPRRHVDYSELKTINRLQYGEEATIVAQVWDTGTKRIQGGRSVIITSVLNDGTGAIEVTFFGQPWLANKLTPGRQVQVAGRVDQYLGRLTLARPALEDIDRESLHTGRIVPVYSLTKDVSANAMRRWMYEAVSYTAPKVSDPLPESVRTRARLMPYSDALLQIHFPDSQQQLAASRKRLAFDEMLLLQLGVQRQKAEWKSEAAQPLSAPDEALNALIASLPYALTGAQQRAVADVRADLSRPAPMNRLLQGDVGSGKTVVAALALAVAVGAGAQAALMAPTAILADQHHRNLQSLLSPLGCRVALLLGSTPESEKREIYDGLREGTIKIVIGTQALIQDKVEFAALGLVVVDEQHRFGVAQRARLRGKGGNPHLLVMTATPIPRTLALTLYGDLDLSILDEMPPGRLPIDTRIVFVDERERAYRFLRSQAQQGRQAYVICPLVEESEKVEARAAVEEYERLKTQVFPDLRLGLLHGRMKADEKEGVMAAFRDGETQVLVSTSVVEVGVDVPNAGVVLVEGANRFGLSQLHQFRGRVGRGAHQSYCLLASDLGSNARDEGNERLRAMEQTQDGFVLAEKDLELRGPGEFLGTRQSGFGDLRLAKLTDLPLIDLARREAAALLAADPKLERPEHAAVAERLAEFWRNMEGAGDVS